MTKTRRLRWGMQEVPPTKHPYRDTALVYGALAILIVLFAWVTGGDVGRAVLIAAAAWVAASAWSMIRVWQRRRNHERTTAPPVEREP